jgi:hypothetical protein
MCQFYSDSAASFARFRIVPIEGCILEITADDCFVMVFALIFPFIDFHS